MKQKGRHTSQMFINLIPLMGLIAIAGCTQKDTTRAMQNTDRGAKPIVVVSILPQAFFVNQIGADTVETMVLVGPGKDPHTYEPTPKQMQDLSRASAWILSNTDFEFSLRPKIASLYPSLLMVDGTEGVQFRMMEAHHHEGEDTEDTHTEGTEAAAMVLDRHTWLGRDNAKILAAHVRDTLKKLLPQQAPFYDANYTKLVAEIDQVFNQLDQDLAGLRGTKVFVFHPSFGYFFDEFGIQQEAIETGGKEPNAQTLAAIMEEARKDKVKVIFVQAQFPTTAAKTIAESLGAQVAALDPLAADWMGNIKLMGDALRRAAK